MIPKDAVRPMNCFFCTCLFTANGADIPLMPVESRKDENVKHEYSTSYKPKRD
jgi:hypothetical protein